jgi:DNA recombination protein RmuC
VDGLGKALTNAVSNYNKTIGSLEGRVLVSARKLSQMGVVDAELQPPTPVEETVRALSAPDLLTEAPELSAGTAELAAKTAPQLVPGPRAMGAAG